MDFKIVWQLIQTLIALAVVIALAYLVLKAGNKIYSRNNNFIKIIEKTNLSNHSYIAVAKIGKNYCLMSVTQNEIKILKDISPEEIETVMQEKKQMHDEKKALDIKVSSMLDKLTQVRKNRE